jgi:HK97 family phage prohead protease
MTPGCFAKTLREATAVPLLFNHAGMPVASYPGTSELCEDSTGLRNDAVLDLRSSLSNDIAISMSRGDLTKMSFSFAAIKQSWSKDYEERDVTESRLYDTSIVTFPMNPATSAMLRSAMQEGLGREGMGILASLRLEQADQEYRAAGDPLVFEQAFRALQHADERAVKQFGQYGRARTFIVGDVLTQARAGGAISAANVALLKQALSALHDADTALQGVDRALDEGQQAISSLLEVANPDNDDPDKKPAGANKSGVDGDQGGGNGSGPGGNPITPNDGAGSREAEMELQERKARGKKFGALVHS